MPPKAAGFAVRPRRLPPPETIVHTRVTGVKVGVGVGVFVLVGVAVRVGVAVMKGVDVIVGVGVSVTVGGIVGVGDPVGPVGVTTFVGVGVPGAGFRRDGMQTVSSFRTSRT